tara:strand:+ start:1012 stop:1704 length:693 start_codon:yes stop_codon:yes gene_type:complete
MQLNIKNTILIIMIIFSTSFSQSRKETYIIDFIESRWSGDTITVQDFLDKDFKYYHVPYIGIGLITKYDSSGLLIENILPFSDGYNILNIGDKITKVSDYLVNDFNISNGLINFYGHEADSIKIFYDRNKVTNSIILKLKRNQHRQNIESFILDIKEYNDRWYNYNIEFLDISIKKNKYIIYYEWEGSMSQKSPTYFWRTIEIIKVNPKTKKIISIDNTWSEKQLDNQFR